MSKVISATAAAAATVATVKEQAGQLVQAIAAMDSAAAKLNQAGGQLATLFSAALDAPAPIVEKVLSETFAQLRAVAEKNVGKKATEAEKAEEWRRIANSAAVVARRVNKGKAGAAPMFGLFYIGLSKENGATVRVIQKPTAEQVRKALATDQRALNSALAALETGKVPASKPHAPKAAPASKPHAAAGATDTPATSSEAAILEQLNSWRPAELEQLAARILNMATAKRAAIAEKSAKPAAKPARAKQAAPKKGPASKPAATAPAATAPTASPVAMPKPVAGAKLAKKGAADPMPVGVPTDADKSAAA